MVYFWAEKGTLIVRIKPNFNWVKKWTNNSHCNNNQDIENECCYRTVQIKCWFNWFNKRSPFKVIIILKGEVVEIVLDAKIWSQKNYHHCDKVKCCEQKQKLKIKFDNNNTSSNKFFRINLNYQERPTLNTCRSYFPWICEFAGDAMVLAVVINRFKASISWRRYKRSKVGFRAAMI